jgi:hypothetical protein
MSEKILGQVRHILTAAVAYMAGKGIITEQFGTEAVALLMVAVPSVWSWFAKKKQQPEPPKE